MAAHLERLLRIYNRLRRGPVTIDIISKWAKGAGIEVSERQLYRDLNQLKTVQVAKGENVVEYIDEKNRKTWKLEYEYSEDKITQYDINSFFLLKNFAPYTILEQRNSSIEKFERIFYKSFSNNQYQKLIDASELYLRRTNYFDQLYGPAEHQQIEDLLWCLHNKRVLVITSIAVNPANIHLKENPFPLQMYPLELVFHRGRVYIAGVGTTDRKLLIFAVDPHLQYNLTNTVFSRKKLEAAYYKQIEVLFGISDPVTDKVHHIKVEFTEGYAQSWMNYFWHASQKWEPLENGNYLLHLQCTIGRELIGFLAYGLDKIKVHEPLVLRNLLMKKLENSLSIHRKDLPVNEEEANRDY